MSEIQVVDHVRIDVCVLRMEKSLDPKVPVYA